jgi:hypothetical protein
LGEFVALHQRTPVLFARERSASAYRRMATDPSHAEAVVQAIHANPDIQVRFGTATLALLRSKADAESAWIIGREHIRHGERRDGQRWLRRSLRRAPGAKRAALLLLSSLGVGPFRPYQFGDQAVSQTSVPAAPRDGFVTISP